MTEPADPRLQAVDDTTRRMARALLGEARHAALASIDPETGAPIASRILMASDPGGDPLLLVSHLSRHTAALLRNPRASLLIGDVAPGDPLAQPRMTLDGTACEISREDPEFTEIRRRFLARHPSASVYADFADFVWLRISVRQASLVAGFARAYRLSRADLCRAGMPQLAAQEREIVERLNRNHGTTIMRILDSPRQRTDVEGWRVVTLDAAGLEATEIRTGKAGRLRRIEFPSLVRSQDEIVDALKQMAHSATPEGERPSAQGL